MESTGARRPSPGSRAAAGFVLALLAAGSLVLWLVVPPLVLWALSNVIDSSTLHYGMAMIAVPVAMVLFASALSWLNELYLRITGTGRSERVDGADYGEDRWLTRRGPLEPLLLGSLAVALVAMALWFFLVAENPLLW
ncbi:MAG TPA: hypothetical protein VFH44_11205 [Solirubrobacterales bacterium]|nr:hypothetical protein [Solirubrobacterales bacterium]